MVVSRETIAAKKRIHAAYKKFYDVLRREGVSPHVRQLLKDYLAMVEEFLRLRYPKK